jgi:hypothetical protein
MTAQRKPTLELGVVRSAFIEKYPEILELWLEQQDRTVQFIRGNKAVAA